MNGAQLHLALNHFPVVLSFVSLGLLFWGWRKNSSDLKKAGLTLVVVGAAFAAIAYLSGDPAEDILKSFPGFAKDLVHEHEEAAEFALITNGILAFGAIIALYFKGRKPKVALRLFLAILGLNFLSCAIYLRTAHLGGLIHHEEIRELELSVLD